MFNCESLANLDEGIFLPRAWNLTGSTCPAQQAPAAYMCGIVGILCSDEGFNINQYIFDGKHQAYRVFRINIFV